MSVSRQSPRMLPLDLLIGHKQNVRADIGDLSELTASIRQHGIVQPIVVTEHPHHEGKYVILAGHRRAAAAAEIPLEQVVCIIRHDAGTADDHVALMLVENMQRQSLSPVEKARAMQKLIDHGLSQSEVARRIGVTPTTVNQHVMLLELSDEELEQIEAGHVRVGDARAAIQIARANERIDRGTPVRGRPPVVEPAHFTRTHPLAAAAEAMCDHTQRPWIYRTVLACGQCWEAVIRDDAIATALDAPEAVAS